MVKNPSAMWRPGFDPWVGNWEDPLEEEMAIHSSISCLENPHGQRSLEATVYIITKNRTQLSN